VENFRLPRRIRRPDAGCLGIGDRHGYMLAP
jgi:hypothetical protein